MLTAMVVDGLVLSLALGTLIVGSLAYNPRLWINDAPPAARQRATPLTARERSDRAVVAVLFLAVIVAFVVWSSSRLTERVPGVPLGSAIVHFFACFMFFNLFDLIVIDWLVVLVLQPAFLRRLRVDGLSYEETVGDFGFHLAASAKGIGFAVVMSLLAGGGAWLVSRMP